MSVYWIGRAQVRDAAGMAQYGQLVARASEIYHPEVIVRAGKYKILEGPDEFERFAVLRFASMEQALTYYNSREYQAAAAVRQASAGRCELALVEGVEHASR